MKRIISTFFAWTLCILPLLAATPSIVKKKTPIQEKTYAVPSLSKKIAPSKGAVQQKDWTVLYYLDADNNLEPFMLDDVNEMEMIGSTDNVNLVALLDRNPGYDNGDGNWTNNKTLFITRDTVKDKISSKVIDDLKEQDMANPQTLAEFLAFGMSNFPANHYAVVLGDHGGSWFNSLNDETNNEGGLHLKELDAALKTVTGSSGSPIDLIVFDMCLMSQLEVMDTISPYAHYAVASEELEPGAGYPNHRVLYLLTKNPKIEPRELAQVFVDEWSKSYAEAGEDTVTIAAIDLGKIPAVVDAVDQLSQALLKAPASLLSLIGTERVAAQHFPGNTQNDLNSYDLGQFASLLSQQTEASSYKPQLDKVISTLKAAVIKHAEGATHQGAFGLSIYFPFNKDVSQKYQTVKLTRTHWDEFLAGQGTAADAATADIVMQDVDHDKIYPLGEGIDVTAKISGSPSSIHASIAWVDDDTNETIILNDEEIPLARSRWKEGDTIQYRFEPSLTAISDGTNSIIAPLYAMSPGSKFVQGYASYNSKLGDMESGPVFDMNKGELETVFCYQEEGVDNPMEVHPVKGEKLVFYQLAYSEEDDEPDYRPVKPLKIATTLKLIKTGLPAGHYSLLLTAYGADGEEAGWDEIEVESEGTDVTAGVTYPDYGFPSVDEDDVEYLDMEQVVGAQEYDHFDADWDDYDSMEETEADDYDSEDLEYLDDVELTDQELAFDEEDFSDEYQDEEVSTDEEYNQDEEVSSEEDNSDDEADQPDEEKPPYQDQVETVQLLF